MKGTTGMFRFEAALTVILALMLQAVAHSHRRPLSKPGFRIRIGQVDNIGRVDYDPKTGNYIFRWKGMDGKIKEAVYVPNWKAKVTVIATVLKSHKGFRYVYVLKNEPNSPQAIDSFLIMMVKKPEQVSVSHKWRFWGIEETMVGKAATFSIGTPDARPLPPGASLRVEFSSHLPPGVTKCYVNGYAPIMRVPEEMPWELEDLLPKGMAQSYLHGWTVAPVENVSFKKLLSDWQIAAKEGWVREGKVAGQIMQALRQISLMVNQKRYEQVQNKVKTLLQFAQKNQKLLEPEAQALLFFTLPYLVDKLQNTR